MDLSWWKKYLFSVLPTSTTFSSIKDRFFFFFFKSLGAVAKSTHDYNGGNLTDVHPSTTTRSDDWSEQFGFATTMSESRLLAEWSQEGGQSPNYLQQKLHDAGYTDLYVHEWWDDSGGTPVARNPIPLINNFQPNNLLVNWVEVTYEHLPQCGDNIQCGDDDQCGDSEGIGYGEKIYPHPDIADEYTRYFYVGGETFPDGVSLDAQEIKDVKRIIYKIKPMEQRCVLLAINDVWVNTPTTGDSVMVNTPTTGDDIVVNIGDV